MSEARDIYQDHIDRVSRAVWSRNLDVALDMLGVAHTIVTADASHVFETHEELRQTMMEFRKSLSSVGATGYFRICEYAGFSDATRTLIRGRHKTCVMRGGTYALKPWTAEMTLEKRADGWKGTHIVNDVRNFDCTILSPETLRHAATQ